MTSHAPHLTCGNAGDHGSTSDTPSDLRFSSLEGQKDIRVFMSSLSPKISRPPSPTVNRRIYAGQDGP